MRVFFVFFWVCATSFLSASESRARDIQAICAYFRLTDPSLLQLYALDVLGTAEKTMDADVLVAKTEKEIQGTKTQEAIFSAFSNFSDEELEELRAIYENPTFQKVQPGLFVGLGEHLTALMREITEREGENRPSMQEFRSIAEITEENFFSEVFLSDRPVVIDFYTDHCVPCRILAPILEMFSKKYAQELRFAKVNCDLQKRLANHFQLRGVPTLLFFEPGKTEPFKKIVGLLPKEQLEKEFSSFKKE